MLQNSSKNSTQAKLKPVIAGKALNFKLGFQQKSDAVLKVRHTKFRKILTLWHVMKSTILHWKYYNLHKIGHVWCQPHLSETQMFHDDLRWSKWSRLDIWAPTPLYGLRQDPLEWRHCNLCEVQGHSLHLLTREKL